MRCRGPEVGGGLTLGDIINKVTEGKGTEYEYLGKVVIIWPVISSMIGFGGCSASGVSYLFTSTVVPTLP